MFFTINNANDSFLYIINIGDEMKYIFLLVVFYIPICIFSETVRIGFFQGYPSNFVDEDSGEVTGSTVEYLRDFILEMGFETEFIGPYPFPRLLAMLKNGELDGLLGLSYIKEREEFVLYPDKPYRVSRPNIFVIKGGVLDRDFDIKAFAKYTYSYRSGAILPDYLRGLKDVLEVEYLARDTWIQQSLQMLAFGRIDGIINMSELSILYEARKLGLSDKVKMVPIPGEVDMLYLGISKASPKGEDFLRKYNRNLKKSKLKIETYDEMDF